MFVRSEIMYVDALISPILSRYGQIRCIWNLDSPRECEECFAVHLMFTTPSPPKQAMFSFVGVNCLSAFKKKFYTCRLQGPGDCGMSSRSGAKGGAQVIAPCSEHVCMV